VAVVEVKVVLVVLVETAVLAVLADKVLSPLFLVLILMVVMPRQMI
tara:strand:- start:343 stop:480 length:138 start_codon:yes stop_codon:yes gene_type:complete